MINLKICVKIESIQYKDALAITGVMQGTSRERVYQEIRLESLKSRSCYKRLSCMFKIINNKFPNYLLNSTPKS